LKTHKEVRMKVAKQPLNAVAVSGLNQAKLLGEEILAGKEDYHIIEVMACPSGCINGGGQKLHPDEKCMKSRMKALYDVDDEEMIKTAHKNPIVVDLYEKFLAKPGSMHNADLLHINRMANPDTP
jgi:iron only hydrogenase large subunit-like protein